MLRPRAVILQGLSTATAAALLATTCTNDASGPGRYAARLAIVPVFDQAVDLAAFNLTIDNVRLLVVRSPSAVVLDKTYAFPPEQSTLQISEPVTLVASPEVLQVTIELRSGAIALFSGASAVEVTSGASTTLQEIVVTYSGPGQNVARLVVTPQDTVLTYGGAIQYAVSAFDAQGAAVPDFYAAWTTSDAGLAIDALGHLTAPSRRGTVTVTARTPPPAVTAGATVTFQPSAASLVQAGGNGQSATAGTTLPQALVARVLGADGLGVRGVAVAFAVTAGGGSLSAAGDTTDANGDASVTWTLGPTAGAPQLVQATAQGLTGSPLTFGATALAGAATQLAFVTAPTSVAAGQAFTVTVEARDAAGARATSFTSDVTLALAANPGGVAFGTPTAAAVAGVATFTGLSINVAASGYALAATAAGLTAATGTPFAVTPAQPAQLAFRTQPSAVTVGNPITPPVAVEVRDAFGNLVTTATNVVTISIADNPGSATLLGTLAGAPVGGVASFPDLQLSAPGSGYTLAAAATGLSGATSAPFDVAPAPAGLVTWINAAGGSWSVPGNWSPARLPAAGDTAHITLAGTYTVTLDVNASVGALTVGAASGQQTLLIVGRSVAIAGASTVGPNGRLVLDDGGVSGAGLLTNQGSVEILPGASTLGAGFANAATGTLTLQGSNGGAVLTVAAGWTNAGVVAITGAFGSTLAVASGTLVNASGAMLRSSGAASVHTLAAALDNRGTLEVQGTNPLVLNRADAAHLNSGAIALTGGDLTVTQTGTGPSLTSTGTITIGTGRTLTVNGGTFLNAGTGLIQGTGTLSVAATAFTNGGALGPGLSAGVLTLNGNYQQASTGRVTIELGGTTLGTEYDQLAVSGPAALDGALDVALAGAFAPVAGNQFTVLTFASRTGDFRTVNLPALGGGLTWQRTFSGTDMVLTVVTGAPASVNRWTNASGGNWSDPGNWSTGAVPDAADSVVIDLDGTYSVTVDQGAHVKYLLVGAASGIQTLVHGAGVTLRVDSLGSIGPSASYQLSGTLEGSLGFVVLGSMQWLGGAMTGPASTVIQQEAVLTISGAGTHQMANGRFLFVNGSAGWTGGDIELADSGSVAVGPGGVLDLQSSGAITALAPEGVLINVAGGTVRQSGTATTVVNAVLDNGGVLAVEAGTLDVNGDFVQVPGAVLSGSGILDVQGAPTVVLDGEIRPGTSPGTLTILGAYAPSPGGKLTVELGGTAVGTQYDRLAVTGAATLDGTLDVTLIGGFTPQGGDQFTILTFESGVGDFTTVNLPALSGGLTWQRTLTPTAMVLTVSTAFGGAPPGTDVVWTGGSSVTWTDAANWVPAAPGATDDVWIRADAPHQPVVTGVRAVDSIVVQAGASVTVGGAGDTLVVGGSLDGGSAAIVGSGTVRLSGTGQTVRGHLPGLVVTGTITARDSVRVAGDLVVTGAGRLDGGAHRVIIEGDLATTASGTLAMTDLDGRVDVIGNATFDGGDTFSPTPLLTGGVLSVGGNFTQPSPAARRFWAVGLHHTRLVGGAGQTVSFADPLTNGFAQLTILTADSLHAGSLLPADDIVVADSLASGSVVVRGTGYLVSRNPNAGNLVLRSDGGRPVRVRAGGVRLFGNVVLVGVDVAVEVTELEYWGDAPVTIPADPRLTFTRLTVRGTRFGAFTSGQTYSFRDLVVTDDASLGVGGATVNLTGDLATGVGGALRMAVGDVLNATTASFGGGSTAGLLTGGTLRVHGDFDQAGDPQSFAPSGAHVTILDGTGGTLTFANPAQAGGSHFQHLDVRMSGTASNGGQLVINGDLVIQDTAQFAPSGIVGGSGNRITVVGSATVAQSRTAAVLTSDVLRFGGAVSRTGGAVVDGDTVEFFGTGQAVPTNLPSTFALKVSGDSVSFTGSTAWRGMLVTGLADIGAATVSVDSTFRTSGNGAIRMTDPGGKLSVRREARFEGGSTAGRMTAGTLDLGGHFSQAGFTSPFSFAPSGSHLTHFRNFEYVPGNPTVVPVTIAMSNTFASQFRHLLIDQEISATLLYHTVATGSVTKPEFATLTGTVLEVGGDLTASGALNGIIDFDTVMVAGAFTPNLSSQDYRITVLVLTGAAQTLPPFPHYATVVVLGESVVLAGGADMLSLFIQGDGLADVGGAVEVVGRLETRDQGRLSMADGSLFVGGDAVFGGGSTAGLLTGGVLTVGGGLTQTGANSASSFAASVGHVTEFVNSDFRALDFATPDSLASHFGTLSVTGAGELRLVADVHAVGQLRTPAPAGVVRKLSGLNLVGTKLVARGLDVDSLDLHALALVVTDGAPIDRFRNVRFVEQDPGVDRLTLRRAAGTHTFERLTFTTAPDPGFVYVSLSDADGTATTPFAVTMSQATPADPGGFAKTDGIASLFWSATTQLGGTVRNAVGSAEIAGATVDLKLGANAKIDDPTLASVLTDQVGGYLFTDLGAADYTLFVSADGFVTSVVTGIALAEGQAATVDVALSPLQGAGETRIVLSWGATPPDLDAHLLVPDTLGGQPFHVYYGAKGDATVYPFARLDADDTDGYGPETITIYQQLAGVYRFQVHDFAAGDNPNSTTLLASGARVDVYQDNALKFTFTVPNKPGTLWTVFELAGATLTRLDTMSGDPPGPPAGAASAALKAERGK